MSSQRRVNKVKSKSKIKEEKEEAYDSEAEDDDFNQSQSNPEEESSQSEDSKPVKKEKKGKKGRDKKRLHNEVMKFIDRDAEDAAEDEDEIKGNKEDQYYKDGALAKRNPTLDLDALEEKHRKRAYYEEERERLRLLGKEISPRASDDGYYSEQSEDEASIVGVDDKVRKQQILPSIDDPKLWQVRVKKNFEKIAVMALLNKSIDFAQKGRPLSILSATCSESTEGWIYVEAFKEIHIKQACQNLHFCLNKFILLPQEQMTDVYSNDKAKHNELKLKQWVRIKNGGIYNGDIGLVEGVQESKVFVRLIPRIDLSNVDKSQNRFVRIPQRIGYQPPKADSNVQTRIHDILGKNMTEYKRMLFYRGFLFKQFPFKQVESTSSIKPTHEEMQNFQLTVSKSTSQFGTDDLDDDDAQIEDVIRKTLMKGGTTVFTKGDKIRVHKGDLTGIKGTVISIEEGGLVTFKPMNLAELKRPLQIDISMLTKYFEPGDLVRVTEGKYKGDTGQVIDVDAKTNKVSVVLDQSQQEIRIIANQLKLKSDNDQPMSSNLLAVTGKNHGFKAGDLVNYNGNKNAGYVLQVQEDFLKMINEQNKIASIKFKDLGKKFDPPRRGGTLQQRDCQGNALGLDQMVKVREGTNRGISGPIRHGYRHYLFLFNKEFVQSNGIFVEDCKNVIILGAEFMKGSSDQAVVNQNRMIRDPLVGKVVVIIFGKFKGHRGRVTYADDKNATVELSTQCKKIPIDKSFVQLVEENVAKERDQSGRSVYGNASVYGGATVYDGVKTPMHGKNTPSYYPQSQWGGGQDYDNNDRQGNEFIMKPGSEHYSNEQAAATFLKKEAGGWGDDN